MVLVCRKKRFSKRYQIYKNSIQNRLSLHINEGIDGVFIIHIKNEIES